MLDINLQFNSDKNSVQELAECIRQGIPSAVFGLPESFKNYLVSTINSPVLYLVKDSLTANQAIKDIKNFSNKTSVYIPPREETLILAKAFSKDGVYDRITAVANAKNVDVVIVTPQTLLQTICTSVKSCVIKKDDQIALDTAISTLVGLGYERVETLEAKGCFSVRGDIIDVFPINSQNPIRFDFFGDTVESCKIFDVESRKTIEYVNQVQLLQASEFIFDEQDKKIALNLMQTELSQCKAEKKSRLTEIYQQFALAFENNDWDTLSALAPINKNSGMLISMLAKDTVVCINDGKQVYDLSLLAQQETAERFNSLQKDGEVFGFIADYIYSTEDVKVGLSKFMQIGVQTLSAINPFFNPLKIINPTVSGVSNYHHAFGEVFNDIKNWLRSGYRVLICTETQKRADLLWDDLNKQDITASVDKKGDFSGVNIVPQALDCGFVFHEQKTAIIGSGNLYTKSTLSRRIKSKRQAFFSAPEIGDYCVHEVHGIGRALGNKKISTTEGTKDYISVEYAGGDVLYIPVEQMDILTRYLGAEKKPKLSKIGGKDFERIKNAVKESIKKMSFDLKKLYQERQEQQGFCFIEENELQSSFEDSFPFEETADQITAIREIKEDMNSSKVMDRLVCGDVGFGKTEVAFRAAFRAIANGKQVAMLAPTTILTEQHYNTALQRFSNFGVRLACLNRFKTPKQQAQIVKLVKDGSIDFVIGTHRLLGKDVQFNDLGLLILDEEQRFGVEHKEKIKLLKNNVDTLTLTATPIPRTLHMSLAGIRSISTINTPPKKRLPVQTYVTEETDALIKDAINREINRGGQVFVLYNRVETIDKYGEYLRNLVPNLKITLAHGQMDERVLEKNIMEFYNGQTDVLLSTTIIENGIDLPRANTLIVIDADRLGLSSLYQLKGRVGRSDRLAYAYFTYKREKILTANAQERLNAIVEFAEMGSGIKIAMRDLEIRGAGNILGAEQHGHMDKIGYELYSKLLREELSETKEIIPELDIRVNAYIPEDYIESHGCRMDIYKQIAEIDGEEQEKEVVETLLDVYGEIPAEVQNLIDIAVIKRLASKISVKDINVMSSETSLVFDDYNVFSNQKLLTAIDCFGRRAKICMSGIPKIEFLEKFANNAEMLNILKEFLLLATK